MQLKEYTTEFKWVQILTILFVILPIHISYQKGLGFYLSRLPDHTFESTLSIPVSFFWIMLLTPYLWVSVRIEFIIMCFFVLIFFLIYLIAGFIYDSFFF